MAPSVPPAPTERRTRDAQVADTHARPRHGHRLPRPGRPGHGVRRRPRRRRGLHAHELGVRQCGRGLRAGQRRLAHTARDGPDGRRRDRRRARLAGRDRPRRRPAPRGQRRRQHTLAAARRPARDGTPGRRRPVRRRQADQRHDAREARVRPERRDAATPANISGFLALWGKLVPLPGSTRPLSTAAPDPAQVEFSPTAATSS